MRRLNQAGDTIVEVLICLAIMSLIVGGAYSIARRSLTGIRTAQERAEATKFAETQIERARYLTSKGRFSDMPSGPAFCIPDDLVAPFPANCTRRFYSISETLDTSKKNLITVSVTWSSLGGDQERVDMYYRVFER